MENLNVNRQSAGELHENRMIRSKTTKHTTTENFHKKKKKPNKTRAETENKLLGSVAESVYNLRLGNKIGPLKSHNMTLNIAMVSF